MKPAANEVVRWPESGEGPDVVLASEYDKLATLLSGERVTLKRFGNSGLWTECDDGEYQERGMTYVEAIIVPKEAKP
jgi:hypothetical protein